jgi:hypothetical protein
MSGTAFAIILGCLILVRIGLIVARRGMRRNRAMGYGRGRSGDLGGWTGDSGSIGPDSTSFDTGGDHHGGSHHGGGHHGGGGWGGGDFGGGGHHGGGGGGGGDFGGGGGHHG